VVKSKEKKGNTQGAKENQQKGQKMDLEAPAEEEVTVPTTIPEAFIALAKEARGA
jgi:hypothetical protein